MNYVVRELLSIIIQRTSMHSPVLYFMYVCIVMCCILYMYALLCVVFYVCMHCYVLCFMYALLCSYVQYAYLNPVFLLSVIEINVVVIA